MTDYMNALLICLQPVNFLLIIAMVSLGIVFGAIPGLSATLGIALLLPITFGLSTETSFVLLLAIWIGGVSGTFISAVLIGIPGSSSAIATCFDGFPMTKKGQAGKALGIGMTASFIGTVVSVIIATGGPGMVKAAYSAGKPAIGVGAGNSPAYIEKTADVKQAVKTILASKTFDYGTICASEQAIICEESNHAEVVAEFKSQGGYFMTKEETDKVCALLFKNGHNMNAKFVGRSPQIIAQAAGIQIPEGTKVLIGKQEGVGEGYPLSFEKLTTVLGFYTVKDWEEACGLSIRLLQNGIGHTMSIHTQDRDKVVKFAAKPASRILVNTGGSQGGTGISTGLPISFTLGCGTCGGSSVSENVSPKHLLNIKKVAFGIKDCATLAENDDSFIWKKESGKAPSLSSSPADLVASFDKKVCTPVSSCQECSSDSDNLAALVKEIVLAMKGQ